MSCLSPSDILFRRLVESDAGIIPDHRLRQLMGDAMSLYQLMVHFTAFLSVVPLPEVAMAIPVPESDDDQLDHVNEGGAGSD